MKTLSVTVWDRWEIRGNLAWTLQQFIDAVLLKYGVKVKINSSNQALYWP
jgi:hypothetical protein